MMTIITAQHSSMVTITGRQAELSGEVVVVGDFLRARLWDNRETIRSDSKPESGVEDAMLLIMVIMSEEKL